MTDTSPDGTPRATSVVDPQTEIATLEAKPSQRSRFARNRSLNRTRWWIYAFLILFMLLSIFPFYWMIVVASNDTASMNNIPPKLTPGPNFWDHARQVFEDGKFLRSLINSFVVATSIAVAQVFFATLAGFAFAKMKFPFRNLLFYIVVGTMMVPLQLGVIPQFMLISNLGWVNSLRALIVPGMVSAFGVFWMRQYIDGSVPDELLQAAKVDGASIWRQYWNIVVPMVRPAAAVLGLFAFMAAWNDFFWPLIVLNSPDSFTVQVALRQLQNTAYVTDFGVQFAGIVIATIPLILIFVFLGKQLIGGIMDGALKS
ncbi:MAG: carbohydrate ABC transporter permease [Acidimicrobiia bacterium]